MSNIKSFLENLTGQETVDLVIAVLIIAVLDIFSPLFSYAVIKIFKFKEKGAKIKKNAFYIPLKSFFKVLGVYLALLFLKPTLNIDDNFMNIATKIFKVIVILNTAIGLAKSIDKESFLVRKIIDKSEKNIENSSVKFLIRMIKVLIYIIAGFMIIAELGYDLSGLVTGLGLGSVVLTLAAQDTLKNLFSGIMIALDKPFQVGDYVKFGTYEGTIEDITFRSTRVRMRDNSLAQVPNSVISSTTVVNISRIKKRLYEIDLQVNFDTSLAKLSNFEHSVLDFLNNYDMVVEQSANVFLKQISDDELTYNIEDDKYYIYVNIEGEKTNSLIGYRGENLNALQTLLGAISNKNIEEKTRVILDISGYRVKRKKVLEELAEKVSKTVIKTRKKVTLEPMSAYERKIIHSKLQNHPKVTTESVGEEPNRKIVVLLKK